LLGRLDAAEEVENTISDEIFRNDHLADVVDSVEDEIIEEYAEGVLDPADRKSVEEYFLRSPERRARLQFFRTLQNHLETASADYREPDTDTVHAARRAESRFQIAQGTRFRWQHVLIWGQAAALVALSFIGVNYVSGLRMQQSLLEANLKRERERSTTLAADLAQRETALTEPISPHMVGLTLATERSRAADAKLPQVELRPSTQRIIVEIALTGQSAGPYEVYLETRGSSTPLWPAKLLPIVSPSGDARLFFDLPAEGLKAGVHSIRVFQAIPGPNGRRYYDFSVERAE
jgi:anti-sigma factor RsiW